MDMVTITASNICLGNMNASVNWTEKRRGNARTKIPIRKRGIFKNKSDSSFRVLVISKIYKLYQLLTYSVKYREKIKLIAESQ